MEHILMVELATKFAVFYRDFFVFVVLPFEAGERLLLLPLDFAIAFLEVFRGGLLEAVGSGAIPSIASDSRLTLSA